ncbi:MAG: 30S ribosomal protein S1, partial [Deltaproteobacteria bacterium]
MDETIDIMNSEEEKNKELMELYNKSFKELQEGDIVGGEIVHIDRDREFALVDIGYKTEGVIPIKEFVNKEGEVTIKVGDKIEALLIQKDEEKDVIVLSKEKARQRKSWNMIEDAFKNNGTIKGYIKARTKGGFFVDIDGVQAFLPGSQLDFRPVKNWDTFIGTEHEFMVIKLDKYKKNIVLSRKAVLEQQKETMRKETMERLKEGAILEGKIKSITDYGLFVDLGGIDGLVHITDISWGRITNPINLYKPGDEVKVKVLKFDKEKDRISLGIKQLTPDPWTDAEKKYPIGAKVKAKVTGLKDYGAFVELEPGVEGLIHISEMSWTKKIRHPSQMVEVDDIVEVVVLDINVPKRRIALGLRQVKPNPWDIVEEKYPVGTILKGKVRSVTDFGVFVGVEEGIDGLVHISDISWSK